MGESLVDGEGVIVNKLDVQVSSKFMSSTNQALGDYIMTLIFVAFINMHPQLHLSYTYHCYY